MVWSTVLKWLKTISNTFQELGDKHKLLSNDWAAFGCHHSSFNSISFPELRSPWPAVEKRELWEHPFQACAIACHRCRLRLRSEPDNQNAVICLCYFKLDAARALVSRPLVKGNEALVTRLASTDGVVVKKNHPNLRLGKCRKVWLGLKGLTISKAVTSWLLRYFVNVVR